jgi:sporulation protein YqfC
MAEAKESRRRTVGSRVRGLMTEVLELPKDLILNLPRITMVGNVQMTLENHRGVILYTDQRIKVAVEKGEVEVLGRKLTIRSIFSDEIIVDGVITGVNYTN